MSERENTLGGDQPSYAHFSRTEGRTDSTPHPVIELYSDATRESKVRRLLATGWNPASQTQAAPMAGRYDEANRPGLEFFYDGSRDRKRGDAQAPEEDEGRAD